MRKGFTLIELLVVVLIIGILTAIALPQYEKAVNKTRTMTLLPLLRSISDAEQRYYMANGTYTLSFSDLDIAMPAGAKLFQDTNYESLAWQNFSCFLRATSADERSSYSAYCYSKASGVPKLEKYFARSNFICWAESADQKALDICYSISGKTKPSLTTGTQGIGFYF